MKQQFQPKKKEEEKKTSLNYWCQIKAVNRAINKDSPVPARVLRKYCVVALFIFLEHLHMV